MVAQKVDPLRSHKQLVSNFYNLLFKEVANINESASIFGEEAFLFEEHLYDESCTSPDSLECASLTENAVLNPTKSKSLLFDKLKSLRDSLTVSTSAELIQKAVREMKFRKKNVAELSLSGRIIIVMFSDPEIDHSLYITNIFLPNGASIFNFVSGMEDVYYR